MQITQTYRRWTQSFERTLTIVAAPVYVDAAAIVAGELSEGETCGVRWGERSVTGWCPVLAKEDAQNRERETNHMRRAHLTDRHSHRPGHMSRKWGCSVR